MPIPSFRAEQFYPRWQHARRVLPFFFDVAGDRYRLAMVSRDGQRIDVDGATLCLAGLALAMVQS
jgi:hypothetical protein